MVTLLQTSFIAHASDVVGHYIRTRNRLFWVRVVIVPLTMRIFKEWCLYKSLHSLIVTIDFQLILAVQ